jgi:YD repeat-containing protein
MTTTKQHDFLNRLSAIASAPSAVSSAYAYNNANQRTRSTLGDSSLWSYEYDSLGQVKTGKRYWSDWTPVAGQQFEYGFDDIGNRIPTKAGGDQNGASLRAASYTNNALNQITGRGVPGYVDVLGVALATNSVTVNSQTAYRKGEYFREELAVGNGASALWTNITVNENRVTALESISHAAQIDGKFSVWMGACASPVGVWFAYCDVGLSRGETVEAGWPIEFSGTDFAYIKISWSKGADGSLEPKFETPSGAPPSSPMQLHWGQWKIDGAVPRYIDLGNNQ